MRSVFILGIEEKWKIGLAECIIFDGRGRTFLLKLLYSAVIVCLNFTCRTTFPNQKQTSWPSYDRRKYFQFLIQNVNYITATTTTMVSHRMIRNYENSKFPDYSGSLCVHAQYVHFLLWYYLISIRLDNFFLLYLPVSVTKNSCLWLYGRSLWTIKEKLNEWNSNAKL